MATRLRPSGLFFGIPAVSPAFDAGWGITTGAVRRHLLASPPPWKVAVFNTQEEPSVAEASASVVDVLIAQFVGAPLSAQSISGTLKGQMRCATSDSGGNADMRAQLLAKVVSNDGSTVRGTLLGFDTGGLSSEWGWSAFTWANRQFPRGGAQSLSPVSAQDGDRVVLEVGYRAHNTLTTSYTGYLRLERGEMASDLPEDETSGLAYWPWFEFSSDLSFQSPEQRISTVLLEVVMNNPNPEIRVSTLLMEVVSEEFWHGWGMVMDSGQD